MKRVRFRIFAVIVMSVVMVSMVIGGCHKKDIESDSIHVEDENMDEVDLADSTQGSTVNEDVYETPEKAEFESVTSDNYDDDHWDDGYQETYYSALDFLEEGYHIVQFAEGDLNTDRKADRVQVIEKDMEEETLESPKRIVQILLGNGSGNYILEREMDHLVYGSDEGGVFGDPFDSIVIDKGVFTLYFYGGSNDRWSSFYSYQYVEDDYYLTHYGYGSYNTNDLSTQYDLEINLLENTFVEHYVDSEGGTVEILGDTEAFDLIPIENIDMGVRPVDVVTEYQKQQAYEALLPKTDMFASDYTKLSYDIDSVMKDYIDEGIRIENSIFMNGVYYYRPLTFEETYYLGIPFDSCYGYNGQFFLQYDQIEGEDGYDLDDDYEDHEITVQGYADIFNLRVPTIEELEMVLNPYSLEAELCGWPDMYYWTSSITEPDIDQGYDGGAPIIYSIEDGGFWDFDVADYGVILALGEPYEWDYTGDYRENTIDASGNYVITFGVYSENEGNQLIEVIVTNETEIIDEHGNTLTLDQIGPSQLQYGISVDEEMKALRIIQFDFRM